MIYIEETTEIRARYYGQLNSQPMVMFDSVFERGTVTNSGGTDDGAAANAINRSTSNFWTPDMLTAHLTVALDAEEYCDCAAIVGHTLFSEGCNVQIDYDNGSGWTKVAEYEPTSDDPFFIVFDEVLADNWRVRIFGDGDAPSVAVIMLGKRLVLTGGVQSDYVPINRSRDIELLSHTTRKGHFIPARVKSQGASGTVNFAPFDTEWMDENILDFEHHYNNGGSFVFASAPSLYPNDATYCWRGSNTLRPMLTQGGLLTTMSLSVRAYVE